MNEEGEIDDYWENLIEEDPSIQLPEEGIHSPLYTKYMATGVIAEIDDPEGSYYDYNFNEVGMSSLLNHDRKVIVDKKVYQYGLDAYYVTENDGLTTAFSYGFKEVSSNGRTAVANPEHAWQFFGTTNNGWYTKDKRRYKVWLEGSSKIVGSTQEVTNIFRAQTQKKRFGTWKYYNTRSITISDAIIRVKQGTWQQYERDVFAPYTYLPLITSVPPVHEAIESNPFNWSGLVNNLYLNLWPHNYGIVRSSGIFSDNSDGVIIPNDTYIDISVTFNGYNFVLARNGGINY